MKKNRSYRQYQEKKRKISGKTVVGIDPAKEKHQVTVVDGDGLQKGGSFSIPGSAWRACMACMGSRLHIKLIC